MSDNELSLNRNTLYIIGACIDLAGPFVLFFFLFFLVCLLYRMYHYCNTSVPVHVLD